MSQPETVLTIEVKREEDGQYFASWETGQETGCGNYSATVIGAVAEVLCTLVKVEEDRVSASEGRKFSRRQTEDR